MDQQLAEVHPILWWLFALAGVSGALGIIWRVWLRQVVTLAAEVSILLRDMPIHEIVEFLRDIRNDVRGVEKCMEEIVEELRQAATRLDDHGERINRLEEAVMPREK